ncbi:nonribosomal peptide synthetase-like protein 2 [Westerdykella ornata]|uniref:Nonribosomal peptide synthetase-like protein 2 n=1 Tax=Westerdykella ornata TaxID=318751 RepID=A0A6A6JZ77_WESOR|nr:nonribosomal peptide synthetase-like protein 2 [Westerdykella ornata]KAF2281534.1 nonribosomal peptide synthetase-like protein 2 [Westerdykella ornata]
MTPPSNPGLSILNGHPSLIPGPTLLHELVPSPTNVENLAIDFLEDGIRREISYKSLHSLSDLLARRIASALATLTHACPVVPIFLPQCPELYIAILAVLKAGKAFCPLSLDTPSERLEFILGDLNAGLVVTTLAHRSDVFARTNIITLYMDGGPYDDDVTAPPSVVTTDLAYVLYTSGSTGLPKAVGVSHQAVTQSLLAHHRHIPDFNRFLQFAAPTFDVSIFEIFFTLFRGRTIVGCSRSRMLADLPATINKLHVDAAELTPTVVGNLLQGRTSVPSLTLLLTIGEMLTRKIIEDFGGDSESQSILWGMYGPTEAAIHCTLQAGFQKGSVVGNIGYPLDTVSIFIAKPTCEGDLAADVTILPIGEVGELVVGGYQLAEGYLNRPEQTAAAFVQHPVFGRLYRTGDRARLLPDGTLECLGRITSGQVKLKGQRVELGEIEQYLSKIEGCLASIVLVVDDILVAFCTVGPASLTRDHIISACKRWLPSYMVPADIVFVRHMPQSTSGKVDRNALRSLYLRGRISRELPTPPESPPNSPIYQILQDVLGRPIPLSTPLASLGLDSLCSIRVVSLLRAKGYNVSAADVMSASHMEDLASICDSTIGKIEEPPLSKTYDDLKELTLKLPTVARYRDLIVEIIPCTPLQEAMLAESMHQPGVYCNWIELELSTFHTLTEIRSHIDRLAGDNEILRSGFAPVRTSTGSFSQIILERLDSDQIKVVDRFSREYTLESDEALLRPFSVQVDMNLPRPKLLFQMHHALYDGWSVDLILRDLNNLFQDKPIDARPPYRQVVQYYSGTQHGDVAKAHISYWSRQLDGYNPINLPNFNGKIIGSKSVERHTRISGVDARLLLSRAQEYSVNPQVFYQAAVIRMMSLFLGSTDVAIGTVTSGRTIPLTDIERIVGPCIASLPLRVDLAECRTGLDVLRNVQRANREMIQHCTLPLKDIVKIRGLRPGTQIFDVLFVWQQSLFPTHHDDTIKILDNADQLEYKLTLEFEPHEDCIFSKATYDPRTFPEASIRHLFHQVDDIVRYLLNTAHENFDRVLGCFSPETLSIANPIPKSKPIKHGPAYAVERWAVETPCREAILLASRRDGALRITWSISYQDLNMRANQLAHALAKLGLQEDELIGVIMEKSIDLYVAILAILKLGHGYLPIVPDTPAERTARILTNARIRICISERAISRRIRGISSCHVIDVDLMDFSLHRHWNPEVVYEGSNVAYAVYTSGSTGTPKGVLVTQDNLMSNIEYLYSVYPTTPNSRLLQACSQAFDVSVFEIFFAWYAGICLCTATKDDLFSDLENSIRILRVTHLSLTPTVASLINPDRVPSVQFLVTAGEALTEHVRRQWSSRGLYQGYGPSETTNICTVRGPFRTEDLINNIGSPFENTSAFVLAPEGEHILPRGAVGELCFGGTQVFRGYMNDPELTARKIIEHPQYGRIYRSGDMGILLPDDSILFTGRIDDQVKIRGQRVELGEITSKILDNNDVEDCVTLLFQLENDNQRLVAFWVPKNASSDVFEPLTPAEFHPAIVSIYQTLGSNLPEYMVPTHLVPISKIPQTAQSKVDKRLLFSTYKGISNEFLEPAAFSVLPMGKSNGFNERERLIAAILADIIKVPQDSISPTASFFNLGLDSLSAVHFSRELRYARVADVPVSSIMKHSTVAALSAKYPHFEEPRIPRLARAKKAQDVLTRRLRRRLALDYRAQIVQVQELLPCTALQEAMVSRSIEGRDLSYCNTMIFSVNGDIHRLQECWAEMFKRHQILRTAFLPTDEPDRPFVQAVLRYEQFQCEEIQSARNFQIEVSKSILQLLQSGKPPIRLMTRQTDSSNQLILCCHHALYDGVAMAVLMKEVEQVYHGEQLQPPVPYEPYLYHVVCHDFAAADRFWESALVGIEPTNFPSLTGNTKDLEPTLATSVSSKVLSTSLSEASRFSHSIGVSLLSVIQATWAKLLYFYTGEQDLCFGNVVSGRTLPEDDLDRLVAPCFNTVPVRVNTGFEKSNICIVKEFHAFGIDSMPYQLTPLRRIQAHMCRGQGPLFNTIVLLQQPTTALDKAIWTLDEDIGDMELPVVCEVLQETAGDLLRLNLHHDTSLISIDDAKVVLETFSHALQCLLKFPDAPARDTIGFPRELLATANPDIDIQELADSQFLHSAFERNVMVRPGHIALDFIHSSGSRTSWSFEQLNALANQTAHCLISQGIGPEDIVPIHMLKGPQFYASVLGVLKAGAAFTPFNPDLPKARKEFMLAELSSKAILCAEGEELDWCPNIMPINVSDTQQYSTENPTVPDLAPTNLAYCLYTSGSTGVPKAVSMEHRAPIQTIQNSRDRIPWHPDSRLLQYAATTFDMCYYDCFIAWSFGFTLCAAEQAAMLDDLPSVIRSLNVDLLDLTPSVAASLKRAEVPSVRWLYCIGEAMSPEVVKEWDGACVNSYGPTEAAFCTTIFPVEPGRSVNVFGKPFLSTTLTVVPLSGGDVLPIFGVGELYIGGAQLARGYHNRPDLTEERFVLRGEKRFYKSGDMVRMLRDGNFEFIGRADDQVKIRGLRVELGEINSVIQASDDRIQSVTTQILQTDARSKHQLVAFMVAGPSDKEQRTEIKRKAERAALNYLPTYMVPQFYIFLGKIPKSPAGKIAKKALASIFLSDVNIRPDPELDDARAGREDWTETECQIREVFAKISGSPPERINPATTIYQLGLDSISAVQVAAGLRKRGFSVTVSHVLKYMTCRALGIYLADSSPKAVVDATAFDFGSFDQNARPDIVRALHIADQDIERISPCTPVQKGMISQFLSRHGSLYFNHMRLHLHSNVDLLRLQAAWSTAMSSHRMLRTGYFQVDDPKHAFAMIHYAESAFKLPWEDRTDSQAVSTEEWLNRAAKNASDNLHEPGWRIRLVKENNEVMLDLAIFHALYDAQSLSILLEDVLKSYTKRTISPPVAIEPVISTILKLSSEDNTESRDFWRTLSSTVTLNRFPDLSPLRYPPAPPSVLTHTCTVPLREFEKGCRESNITLQAAGIAAWMSLLFAYTGEASATCGVVLSGRSFDAARSVVFPCITTVPFACTVGDDKKGMLKEIMALNAEIQQHQFVPLNEIQRLMGHPNEALFDTLFTFQKIQDSQGHNDLWKVVDEKAAVEYPVSIELEPKGDFLELRLTFLPHVIPQPQASLMLKQLEQLIMDFALLETNTGTEEYDPSLYSITRPSEPILPSDVALLHELVEYSAARTPSDIALEFATSVDEGNFKSQSWTYAQLDSESNKIAHLLISHGARPGSLIGICFDKCPEAYFAVVGILKAGCAFLALDPGAPVARKSYIVQDSGASLVLSMSAQSRELREKTTATVIDLDFVDLGSASTEKPVLSRAIDPQDCSYCLYTSGTTGTPKGCEITHENAVQALMAFRRIFSGHWNSDSRWLQFASFHFDVCVLEMFWTWSVGIRLVCAPRDVILDDLAATINALQVTHIDLTPSLARLLHPDDVPSLCRGVFITGGESLKQEILDVWGPKAVIYNGYGPTEATIGVTMYPRVPENGKPSNIGPQFDNVGSFVLKPNSDVPVLRGGVGELCVSGKLVGKGYLNRPELTSERFPYLARFGERVYRTGDLARILHDGTFDFLGRADDQVKLRGQRLEIGEINSIIKQSASGISDVATLVLKHPKQQKEQLVSFIISTSKRDVEPRILFQSAKDAVAAREACQQRLPGYMVPTHFVSLSAMPLSANNKADHRRLREMYEALSVSDLQMLSRSTEEKEEVWVADERRIAQILQDFLRIGTDVKRNTSLFELGLDSISVIGFTRALKNAGFSEASVSIVLKNDSVSRLAKALSATMVSSNHRAAVAAAQQEIAAVQHRYRRAAAAMLDTDVADIEAVAPCTPLQQGMIARSLSSDKGLYFNAFYFEISEETDQERLRDAWETAFSAIQVLRTAFLDTEDGYMQAVRRKPTLPWKSCDLSGNGQLSDRLQQLKGDWWLSNRSLLRTPFELHLVTAAEHRILAVHVFHALYDGISIDLLFERVWRIYNKQRLDDVGPSFLSALPYGPLRNCTGAREFWKGRIRPEMSRRLTTENSSSGSAAMVHRQIGSLKGFQRVRRRLQVTPQAVLQACWATVLHTHLKGTPTLGVVTSGRSIDFEGAERIIGPMFNTLPYQHEVGPKETWASIIKRTHEFNVAAHPYQHTPLRDIMKWVNRKSDQPLFDNLFVYQVSQDGKEWAKNDLWRLQEGEPVADYPLAFEVEQIEETVLKVTVVAEPSAVGEATAHMLLENFEESLRKALEDPDAQVDLGMPDTTDVDNRADSEIDHAVDSKAATKSDFTWTEQAIQMREVIARVAGTDTAHITDTTSIFELGLDSIDAIKLASRLRKNNIRLRVSDIMRTRTIASMLTLVSGSEPESAVGTRHSVFDIQKKRLEELMPQLGVSPANVDHILPVTPLQEAMVAEMLASEYREYYNHDVLKLTSDVDVEKLRHAFEVVVTESSILRTSFLMIDDPRIDCSFAQLVHREPHDFFHYWRVDTEPDFTKVMESMREKAMAVGTKTPLFHINIVESAEHTYLVLSISHALYDGWSLSLLHSDINEAYHGSFKPRLSYEPALRDILNASGPEGAEFWRDYLSDAKPSMFKRRESMESPPSPHVHRLEQNSQIQLADLTAFAKGNNITLQSLGQTAYALVLASYVQSLDVTFGCVLSGRDDEQMSNILFPTMNTVAIRAILHGSRKDMLQYMQRNLLNLKPWQHFPLRKAQALAGAKGRLFESLFIYQRGPGENYGRGRARKKLYESVGGQSDVEYPVCVEMEVASGQLIWRCAVKDDVFDATGAEEFLNGLDKVMRAMMEQPDEPTIEFAPAGVSVCGLPAFQQRDNGAVDSEKRVKAEAEPAEPEKKETTALKNLRDVLALVSGIPEEEIKKDMTIFHLGLDSISAIKVSAHLRKRGIKVTVGDMLKAGSIGNLAKLLQGRISTKEEKARDDTATVVQEALRHIDRSAVLQKAGIEEVNVERILPTTAGQRYMMSMWLKSQGALFYPEFPYRLEGDVSFVKIQQSWQRLVAANPILRTSFIPLENNRISWLQVVLHKVTASVKDITGLDQEAVAQFVEECALQQPYAQLFAAKGPTEWTLRLKIHHGLYDGVSLPLLMRQFCELCNGSELPAVPQDIFDKFIATSVPTSAQEQRRSFWANYLRDLEPSHLPQPASPPILRTEIFKPALVQGLSGLDALARSSGLTIQSFVIAPYAKLYASMTATPANQDVLIGIYLANRSHPRIPDLSDAPIPTVNLVPLRVNLPLQKDVLAVAAQVQKDIQAISNEVNASVSLQEIWQWTGVRVDTFLNVLKLPDVSAIDSAEGREDGLRITPVQEWDKGVERVVETPRLFSVEEIGSVVGVDAQGVGEAYLHAVDVEVTVRNGALDVGVFAPEEMLGLRSAEELVEGLRREIVTLLEE